MKNDKSSTWRPSLRQPRNWYVAWLMSSGRKADLAQGDERISPPPKPLRLARFGWGGLPLRGIIGNFVKGVNLPWPITIRSSVYSFEWGLFRGI